MSQCLTNSMNHKRNKALRGIEGHLQVRLTGFTFRELDMLKELNSSKIGRNSSLPDSKRQVGNQDGVTFCYPIASRGPVQPDPLVSGTNSGNP